MAAVLSQPGLRTGTGKLLRAARCAGAASKTPASNQRLAASLVGSTYRRSCRGSRPGDPDCATEG